MDLVFVKQGSFTVFSSEGSKPAWDFVSELTCGSGIILTKELGLILYKIRSQGFSVVPCRVKQPQTLNAITFKPIILHHNHLYDVIEIKRESVLY